MYIRCEKKANRIVCAVCPKWLISAARLTAEVGSYSKNTASIYSMEKAGIYGDSQPGHVAGDRSWVGLCGLRT